MEGLIHHFKLYTEGYHVPAGEFTRRPEAPKGEFGVFPRLRRHEQEPYRCKIRAPGYAHLQPWISCAAPPAGRRLGDPRSLDIVFGEVDR